jgi:uncharacterized protein YdeI (YjbR/CyaY-like superfamily)
VFDSDPIYFAGPAEFRVWLEEHHDSETEVVVGYWKARTGKPSIRWEQAVAEALCFGWIDGQRRSVDDERSAQRFTPRKGRRWSAVNVRLVAQLESEGRMTDAGRRAFEARDTTQTPYSTSDRPAALPAELDARLPPRAKAFWDSTPPSYRKAAAFWITEAKRPETREKRFAELVHHSGREERLPRYRR